MTSLDIEGIREHLEQLMNEASIKKSIRKQIVTLQERNQTHKKRINIEHRVLKNLKSQGVLDKIIDHVTSSKDIIGLSESMKDSESAPINKQPISIDAKNVKDHTECRTDSSDSKKKILSSSHSTVDRSRSSIEKSKSGEKVLKSHGRKAQKKTSANSSTSSKKTKSKRQNHNKEKRKKETTFPPTKTFVENDTIHSSGETVSEKRKEDCFVDKYHEARNEKFVNKYEDLSQNLNNHFSAPPSMVESTVTIEKPHEDKSNSVLVKINPRKRHLHFEILQGKAFLDHLLEESYSMFVLFVYFRGQRFWTQPVPCKSQPKFDAGFLCELHVDKSRENLMANASQLLNISDKIHIVLVRILPSGEKVLVSSHYFEWRHILSVKKSQKVYSVALSGVGAESNVTVGMIEIRLTLIPTLVEPLKEEVIPSRILVEKRKQEELDRIFLMYAKTWWKEYLSLRPDHSQRTVKIFQQDENAQSRPVFHFIRVLKVGRPLLELPQESAWFVSLIPLEPPSLLGALPAVEQWWVPHTFLCLKKGSSENHATLLCSLFLGFGLDAFVCIGTKGGNIPWAWVATLGKDDQITFWESTTGARYKHDIHGVPSEPYKLSYPYKTVGCIFNHKTFYANVQETDKVKFCNFNVGNSRLWKSMSEAAISSVVLNNKLSLLPGWTEPYLHSQEMEIELRARITDFRQNINLPTRWDVELCDLVAPVLAVYEIEHRMGHSIRKEEIDDLISKNIPQGCAFRALPLRVATMDKKRVLGVCLQNTAMKSIVTCPEPGCKLGLRVHTYVYPENILSIWLIIACKFRSD